MGRAWMALVLGVAWAIGAAGLQVQNLAFLDGEGESEVWGLGLVTGLRGTGDRSDTMFRARQIARLMEEGGNEAPSLEEIVAADNVAVVMVQVKIPAGGVNRGDQLDVSVQAYYNATSLRGGRLFITPLRGPLPGQGVFAFASGAVEIESEENPTSGVIRSGATVTFEVRNRVVDEAGGMQLNIRPEYAGWPTARLLAGTINQHRQGFFDTSGKIAEALDANTVRVLIPEAELVDPANFIGDIMSVEVSPTLLQLPAKVIVNPRRGSIVVTGNVEISPAVIAHGDLVVTTVEPPIEPTPENPRIRQTNAVDVGEANDDRGAARLADLLSVMESLDVPVEEQIAVLAKLHKVGHLHAEFVIDE